MESVKGYYSLLQYCPDRSRREAANIGVVLFVPEADFLQIRVSKNNQRVKRFFGEWQFDNNWLRQAKESIAQRLGKEKKTLTDLSSFEHFIRTRANELIFSDPQVVRVIHPEKDLERLFEEMVGREISRKNKVVIPKLDRAFHSNRFAGRMEYNKRIDVPMVGVQIDIPYIFYNGKPNLIKPQEFSHDPMDKGMALAIRGDLLQKREENKFVVVPEFQQTIKQASELRTALSDLFGAYEIRTVWPEERDAFVEEVNQKAHAK